MNKVHFYKNAEDTKMVTIRKGIFNDPIKDGLKFVVAKGFGEDCKPTLRTGDAVIDNILNKDNNTGEANLVFGWANVTVDEEGEVPEDFQGDMIPTAIMEAAAYSFALSKGYCNEEHKYGTDCGYLIECMMFTAEKMAAMGIPEGTIPEGLWVGFYIPDDEIFAKVKSGEYGMFSIEGYGYKHLINDEGEPTEPKYIW